MKYSLMRFSIRDIFWLAVVVAMGTAWWLDHSANRRPPLPPRDSSRHMPDEIGAGTFSTLAAVTSAAVNTWQGHRLFCLDRAMKHEAAVNAVLALSYINMSPEEMESLASEARERKARADEAHRRLSQEYRLAIWLPWLRLWIADPYLDPPNIPPGQPPAQDSPKD